MPQFIVVKQLMETIIVEQTLNNVADATALANIMRRKNDGWEYSVYQLNEAL